MLAARADEPSTYAECAYRIIWTLMTSEGKGMRLTLTPPVAGNQNGGLLDLRIAYSNEKIIEAADKHCRQFGKSALVTKGRSRDDRNGQFECV